MVRDWRLPENRREAFLRFYGFHLRYRTHPGCVYQLLPAIAGEMCADDNQRAWLVWLNGNTQNVVTSMLLLEAAPTPDRWEDAVAFWAENKAQLEWDTDRRHQKHKFGEATACWAKQFRTRDWLLSWAGWGDVWVYARNHPHMGRLSAWSMIEYARILLGNSIPDADTLLLDDASGSRSHRNGLAVVAGYDAAHWSADAAHTLGLVGELEELSRSLLAEARQRYPGHPDVGLLTLESALCTFKSWHKPNRRYPNVYADMMYGRIKRAEARWGHRFDLLWQVRQQQLPQYLRLEDSPYDPGLVPVKQNHYLRTGEVIMMHNDYRDMSNTFNDAVAAGQYGVRKDPRW